MDLVKYKEKMSQLNQNYDALALVVKNYNNDLYNDIQQNKNDMQAESFQLVVVGEFSRGKSTFVNALLGRKILPAKLKPTTAVLTKIVYGDRPSYNLYYRKKNAGAKNITEEEFLKLIAPKEVDKTNLAMMKNFFSQQQKLDDIEHVEISYPLEICRDNVEIVDTPGTNDLSSVRLDITYNYLNKADAVIMLLSANQALTASELAFLKERVLGNQIKDIFFIISSKDRLKTSEEEKMVLDFVRENLSQIEGMPKKLRIHLLSSLQALIYRRHAGGEELKPKEKLSLPDTMEETGFVELEAELSEFLSVEKGNAKLNKYVARGQEIARQMYGDLSVQLELVSHSADELTEKISHMKPEFERAKAEVESYTHQMKNNLQNGTSKLANACSIATNDVIRAANRAIEYASVDEDGNISESVSSDIERAVRSEKKELVEKLEEIQGDLIEREIENIEKKIRKIWQDLEMDMGIEAVHSTVMNINGGGLQLDISNSSTGNTIIQSLGVGMMIGSAISIIAGAALGPFLVLGALGAWAAGLFDSGNSDPKGKLRKKVNSHYSKEMEDISRAVTDNFKSQIDDICEDVQRNVKSRLIAMENQLQQALAQKKKQEQEVQAERNRLTAHQKQLEQVYKNLTAIVE